MSKPSKLPGPSPGGRPHLKFNRDVLPDFKRRSATWGAEGQEPGEGRKLAPGETDSILKWVGLGILCLVMAAVGGVVLRKDRPAAVVETPELADESGLGAELAAEREQIKQIVAAYIGANTLEEKLKHVRRREAVEPQMREFYSKHELYPLKIWNYESVEPRSIRGWPFWQAEVVTPEGKETLIVEPVGDGFKIDWETHVGWNPMSTDEYLQARPREKMEFRVTVSGDDYYNGPFADSDTYYSAKLEFPDSSELIFGYIELNSPDFTKLFDLIGGGKKVPLLLALEWPEGAGDSNRAPGGLPQLKIAELVDTDWLIFE